MTNAKRLAQACNNYGIINQEFYMACVLLAEHGLESALEFVRKVGRAPVMPAWEQQGQLEQARLA